MKKVYFLPNLITTGSLFCGLLALLHILKGYDENDYLLARPLFRQACWFILASAILDGLDGTVARWTHTASSFGLNYDSLSDLVAFGVTPAILMFAKLSRIDDNIEMWHLMPRVTEGVVALFVICGALRLARFNVQVSKEEKKYFTGLPIPAAAGTIVSTFLVADYLEDSKLLFRAILVLMVVISYLMVSTIPFPSPKRINLRGRKPFSLLVSSVILACIIFPLRHHKEWLVFAGFFAYLIASIMYPSKIRGAVAAATGPFGLPKSPEPFATGAPPPPGNADGNLD